MYLQNQLLLNLKNILHFWLIIATIPINLCLVIFSFSFCWVLKKNSKLWNFQFPSKIGEFNQYKADSDLLRSEIWTNDDLIVVLCFLKLGKKNCARLKFLIFFSQTCSISSLNMLQYQAPATFEIQFSCYKEQKK